MSNIDYFIKRMERKSRRENTEMTIFGIFIIFVAFLAFFDIDFEDYFYKEDYKDIIFSTERIQQGVIDYQLNDSEILFPEEQFILHSFERDALVNSGYVNKSDYSQFLFSFHSEKNFFLISKELPIETCNYLSDLQSLNSYDYVKINSFKQTQEISYLLIEEQRNPICISINEKLYMVSAFNYTIK